MQAVTGDKPTEAIGHRTYKVPLGEVTYHHYQAAAPHGIFTNSYRFECKCGREHEVKLGIGAKRGTGEMSEEKEMERVSVLRRISWAVTAFVCILRGQVVIYHAHIDFDNQAVSGLNKWGGLMADCHMSVPRVSSRTGKDESR